MADFLKLVIENPVVTILAWVIVLVLLCLIVFLYVAAFKQGRLIKFWPPIIGEAKRSAQRASEIPIAKDTLTKINHAVTRSTCMVVTRVDRSPYKLADVLLSAKSKLFLGGQNFQWMIIEDGLDKRMLNFLKPGSGREIGILFCDPFNNTCIDAWATINPEKQGTKLTYRSHIMEAQVFLQKLLQKCQENGISGLNVRVVPLFPLEIIFIDPDDKDAIVALQPIINYGHHGGERPSS